MHLYTNDMGGGQAERVQLRAVRRRAHVRAARFFGREETDDQEPDD